MRKIITCDNDASEYLIDTNPFYISDNELYGKLSKYIIYNKSSELYGVYYIKLISVETNRDHIDINIGNYIYKQPIPRNTYKKYHIYDINYQPICVLREHIMNYNNLAGDRSDEILSFNGFILYKIIKKLS